MERMPENAEGLNGRFTVGFLDENSYYDYHNLMMSGICKAARKYGFHILRFSLFKGHVIATSVSHEKLFQESIRQFRLDGLIYLGWARSLTGRDIREIYGNMPLFSMGMENKGVPSAYFPGEEYVREMFLHLIKIHRCRKIAFIAPYWYDSRCDAYFETMQEFGIFDPKLYVTEADVQSLDFYDRGVRAVQVLLDERMVRPDAIVSLYSDEAYSIFKEMQKRGIRIPEDIALTSYEDAETGKFTIPSLTTIYFPWKELGYFAGEAMYRQLTGEKLPLLTRIPGRIIFRGSCGCIPDLVRSSGSGPLTGAGKCFEELGGEELDGITERIAQETALETSEVEVAMDRFRQAFANGNNIPFLIHMETIFRKIRNNSSNREISTVASTMRRLLLPYFLPYAETYPDRLIWAEDTLLQVQTILQNKLANVCFREDVNQKNLRLKLKEVGQILIANFTVKSLLDSLEINLPKLKIEGCYIYLFGKEGNLVSLADNHLEFEYSAGKRIEASDARGYRLREGVGMLMKEDRPYFLSAHLLNNGDDFVGLVMFESSHFDMGIYQNVAMKLSAALNGIILFEKLDSSYRRLMEQAHKKGMADISTGILHNIGNILNNVNTSAYSLYRLLEFDAINDLTMANSLLGTKIGDLEGFIRNDPKGRTLMQFYVSLKDAFQDFRVKLQENIGKLSDRISLIDEIITTQQSYTGVKSSLTSIDPASVVDDVLKMHQASIERHGIRVERNNGGEKAHVLANRTKLFHVLTNVVKNAMEAMDQVPYENRKLTVDIAARQGKVTVRVRDTGGGIEPEHLEDIFAYGFTTKMDGHGFGLHSCANYMAEMGGRLWAESDGADKGATFVLQMKKSEAPEVRD